VSSLKEVRTRLKSISNIRQITDAMNKIASTRLVKARARVTSIRKYIAGLESIVEKVLSSDPSLTNDFLVPNKSENSLYIIITGDRGMCGDYNTKVSEFALNKVSGSDRSKAQLMIWGKKGADYFSRAGYASLQNYIGMPVFQTLGDAEKIAGLAMELFTQKKVSQVYLVYAEFKSLARQTPVIKQLIPFQPQVLAEGETKTAASGDQYIYEPAPAEFAAVVLPDYFRIKVLHAMSEAVASEQAARMISMEQATHNADDIVKQLMLVSNRLRQTKITKELIEIVAAGEAMQ
jgi:F-type H+-transporting ATPase subunit gamma